MHQAEALAILKSGASVFLTGGPGSGKTHTVNEYVRWLKLHGISPSVTASTGIAATHVGGMTIHSWSGIGIRAFLSRWDLERLEQTEYLFKRITKAQVLIIDEISMLEARIFTMVDQVCRQVRRSEAPFGGLQVVCVGDFFQLPPVSRRNEQAETVPPPSFAFESPAWAALAPMICYLEGQYRQDDNEFLSVLQAIRADSVGQAHLDILESRVVEEAAAPEGIVKLYPHNADVDRVNDAELAQLPGDSKTFLMRSHGSDALVGSLKRGCLSPEVLKLKAGASVMFTKNNPQKGVVNGTLGTVEEFDAMGAPVIRTRGGSLVTAEPAQWSVEDGGRVKAQLEQLPLRLAWAITIHKSQGMSLDAALMDLGSAFEYGQGYVALSRLRRLSGLYLLGMNRRALQVHGAILAKDRDFADASAGAAAAIATVEEAQREEAARAFVLSRGGKIPEPAKAKKDGGADGAAAEPGAKSYSVAEIRSRPGLQKAFARWKEDEERQLVALHNAGVELPEIAKRLGRGRGGVTTRLKKLGLIEA